MANKDYREISLAQRKIESLKKIKEYQKEEKVYPTFPDGTIIPYTEKSNIRTIKIADKELEFIDIGLHLDCIGGSRANSIITIPFGKLNSTELHKPHNYIISSINKKSICAYGNNPYNLSLAIETMSKNNLHGKDYTIHSVCFNKEEETKLSEFFPITKKLHKNLDISYVINHTTYTPGIKNYIKRFNEYLKKIEENINTYGKIVENGRKHKIIFIFLTEEDCKTIQQDKKLNKSFYKIFTESHKLKILPFICVKQLNYLNIPLLIKAEMIACYGTKNSKLLQNLIKKKKEQIKTDTTGHLIKTVGMIYNKTLNNTCYLIQGYTKEYIQNKKELEKWAKQENKQYALFLKSLDNGNKTKKTHEYKRNKILRKDILEKYDHNFTTNTPIIEFT